MTLKKYYDDIPFGANNAVTRAELMQKWGVSDRGVRRIISDLRNDEHFRDSVIVSSCWNEGYFKTTEPARISQFIKETRNRAINTLKPAKNAARVLRILQTGDGQTVQGNMLCGLRDIRKAAGISQQDFEKAMRQRYAEFNRVVLSAVENGTVIMTEEQTQYAAEVLRCDPAEIYPAGGF